MKILIGYDGSNAANDALKLGLRHARAFDAKVHVVTSMSSGSENQQQAIDAAERGLAYAEGLFTAQGLACQSHLLIRGMSPGEDLVAFAGEHQVDEIIVGVKRRSRVGKILMGSTAQFVIIRAACPVVAVK
jgi:nucleotide-binding universal stress UspA family protein